MSSTRSKEGRRRGRPRGFDEGAALDGALLAFWTRGFAGTSMDHLTTAMDLHRPSVYGAFGNKEVLYAAAVERYVNTLGRAMLAALDGKAGLAKEIKAFYVAVIDVVTGAHGPRGCPVACTLPAEAESSPTARRQLASVLARLDGTVQARLAAARRGGELPDTADAKTLAQVVTSGMLALSIRGRSGASRRELTKLARAFVALVAIRDDGTPS